MGKNIRRRTNPVKRSSNVLPETVAQNKKSRTSRPPSVSLAKSRERLYNALDIAEADLEAKRRKNKKAGKVSKHNTEDDDQDSDPDPLAGEDEPIDRNLIAGQEDLDEDEDEEIDSDEAFGSSDEEEILDSSAWKKKRKIRKGESYKPEYDEDELASGDESDASIDKSQLMTLTEVWDLDDKDKEEYEKGLEVKNKKQRSDFKLKEEEEEDDNSEEEEEEDESEDEEEDDSELSLSDDEDADDIDEEQLSNLQAMISNLKKPSNNIKKNSSTLTADDYEKLQQTSAAAESEFSVRSSASGFNSFGEGKLSLADLAGTVTATDKDVASHLKLIDTSTGPSGTSKKEKSMTLAVPLAKHIQQRLERRAAYDLTKEEVNKWKETVNTMKEAEHLSFPMVEPRKIVPHTISGASNDQEPATDMERRINEMLKASQLGPKQSSQPDTFEELAPAQMTLEELQQHRARIRKMKELAYREQQKARRIKKIKSKTYRKIHRKEREREEELMREADSEEEDEEGYDDEHEMQRARERVEQRHKTGGKWARDMIKHGMTKDIATRKDLEEMLRKSEALREKMLGRDGGSDSDDSDTEKRFLNGNESESDDEQTLATKQKLGKGVLAMKFMLDAEEAERKRNQAAKEELRRARESADEFNSDDENSEDGGRTKGANVVINEGRRKYTPGTEKARVEATKAVKEARDEMELEEDSLESRLRASHKRKARGTNGHQAEEEDEDSDVDNSNNGIGRIRAVYDDDENEEAKPSTKKQKKVSFREREQDDNSENDSDDENPWLAGDNDTHKKKSSATVLGRDSSASDKSQAEIKKQRKKAAKMRETKASARDGLIDMNETLDVVDPFGDNDNNDSDSDDDGSSRISFKQTDLVKQAFSGDDVVAEFEEEKASITKRDDDRVEDVTLPGWGGWGGAGLSAKPKKRFVRKVAGVVRAHNRRDAQLENVIINERLTADQSHLHADKLPFPFETREQYERSLRMPIGQEWSTRMAHQNMVKPRVLVKPNLVIEPIRNPFKNDDDSDS